MATSTELPREGRASSARFSKSHLGVFSRRFTPSTRTTVFSRWDLFKPATATFTERPYTVEMLDNGTVFKITPSGKFTRLHSFCAQAGCKDGAFPSGGLVQGTDGNFYGATLGGGDIVVCGGAADGCGTVFKITPDGVLTTLHSFRYTDGAGPGGLLQATNGSFYGTTGFGGNLNCGMWGCGTVFSLNLHVRPFVALVRSAGKVGQTFGVLGQGFVGTTRVSLNGFPAKFTVKSDTFILATVPEGARTGFVRVTTPGGILTSSVRFRVIPWVEKPRMPGD
jgi:uncharacterized repeat protein (TIGR03803 family)